MSAFGVDHGDISKGMRLEDGTRVRYRSSTQHFGEGSRPTEKHTLARVKGETVGSITTSLRKKTPGEIVYVSTKKPYQRKGIATGVFNEAKRVSPISPVHSARKTVQGAKWARAVGKSLVGGQYKAASKLSVAERSLVRNRATRNRAVYGSMGGRKGMATNAKNQKIHPWLGDTPKGKTTKLVLDPKTAGGSAQINGRGGGVVRVNPSLKNDAHTLKHEQAHLSPNRNPHTWQKRGQDPLRRGREEGRADFTAATKATPGKYPGGNAKFNAGYNEVQGKMARAKGQVTKQPSLTKLARKKRAQR